MNHRKAVKVAKIWGLPIALFAMCMGCAGEKEAPAVVRDDLVVAQVGDKTITAEQLRKFSHNLPKRHQSAKIDLEKQRDHLQTMIDMELLMMEVQNERIAQSPGFLMKMNKIRKTKLVSIFQKRRIKFDIKESEIEEYIKKEGLSRALRLSDIMVDSRDKAAAALEEISKGKSFEQVAEKWSMNRDTSTRGGDIGGYLVKEQMIPALQEMWSSLAVGEVSEPIKVAGRYSVFKVIADTTVQLGPQQRMGIHQDFQRVKFGLEKAALVEKLKNEYGLEANHEGLNAFVESLRSGASFATGDERDIVLFTFDKGQITAGEFVDVARKLKGDVLAGLTDSEKVVSLAEEKIIPDTMIMEAALRAGVDREEATAKWLEEQRGQLLIAELRDNALEGKIDLSAEVIQQFYDSHPNKYLHPEQLDIQEILVETEAEALGLIEKIQKGAQMGELARTHTIRPVQDQGDEEGRFHFHEHEIPQFGGLVEAAFDAKIGELTGPVKVKDGYSIFKVLSRERKRETFEEAEWRVRRDVGRRKSREVFEQFIEGLRNKYASQVSIREDHLKTAFETGG